jgi:hypothetical protein
MKTSMVILIVLVSLSLVFSLVSVVMLYENNVELDTKVQALQAQVDSLKSNIERIQQPNLVAILNVYDVNNTSSDIPHYLVISGQVTNVGLATAFNVGLHVVAKDEADNIIIDMTVPIVHGSYGWSEAYNQGPTTLQTLLSQDMLNAELTLYHDRSYVRNWTITPVYTSQP